jgi:hypothetical protein
MKLTIVCYCKILYRKIKCRETMRLILRWLRVPILLNGKLVKRRKGVPQGSPLSPLLSNVMLHELDMEMERCKLRFVRYADDFSIYCKTEKEARKIGNNIFLYLRDKLKLNRGWINYFRFASIYNKLNELDGWLRNRIRYCIWTDWKKPERKRKNLIRLGVDLDHAYQWSRSRKGGWAIAQSPILNTTITVARLTLRGYESLLSHYCKVSPHYQGSPLFGY